METHPPDETLPQSPTRGLRLLVVEGYGDLSLLLGSIFHRWGHDAHFVENAASAEHAASREPFDVLLSDTSLPDGDCWKLLARLDQTGRRPPYAIAMSGCDSLLHLTRCESAGFAAHLLKPFPCDLLQSALQAAREVIAGIPDDELADANPV